ncbi:unnamed protein product [Didymodactylos carnosus]|uniref:Tetraspanin n=1 Tax=Didymodactylos carnosus TaxID=1234261 RepID=A0A8S2GFN6_9BILA|nr:unnamed protein product [Didymodactylos carnosus]CAF3511708.1 unnamed protein product [Didymodactylos carnosus]
MEVGPKNWVVTGISTKFPERNLPQYLSGHSPYALGTNKNQKYFEKNAGIYPGIFNSNKGCFFDPHCPECIRELWGPLLAPFAVLIKQNGQFFGEILSQLNHAEKISHSKNAGPVLQYDDHLFLSRFGLCSYRFAKCFWFLAWLIGFIMLIVGIILVAVPDRFHPLITIYRMNQVLNRMEFHLQYIAIFFFSIGIGKMLSAVLGLLGTAYRSVSVMSMGAYLIFVLFIIEIVCLAAFILKLSKTIATAELALQDSFRLYQGDKGFSPDTIAWNDLHQRYQCCDFGNSSDFDNTIWAISGGRLPNEEMPQSCCKKGVLISGRPATCQRNASPDNYQTISCLNVIRKQINDRAYVFVLYIAMSATLFVQFMAMLLTFIYQSSMTNAKTARKEYNRYLLEKFQKKMTKEAESNRKEFSGFDGPTSDVSDLRLLYNVYSPFSANPLDYPYAYPITPTVVQVKRPEISSYFYYDM